MAEGTTKYTWEDFLKELEGSGLKGQFSEADMRLAQQNPDAGMSILSYKRDYANATNDQARALANAGAERVRSSFGGYTAGEDGSQFYRDSLSPRDFSYEDAPTFQSRYDGKAQELLDALMNRGSFSYEDAPTYQSQYDGKTQELLDALMSRGSFSYEDAPTYQSRYDGQIQERLQGLLDRPDFSYDAEKDPLYSQYRKQYVREGQRASADAMGQAAAMSGGLPSSYAGTAAGQAANYYNAQLTDKIPELEELAYQKYMNDFDMDRTKLSALQGAEESDYTRYLGQLGQYNTDRSFAYGQYMDEGNAMRQNLQAVRDMDNTDYQRYLTQLGQYNTDRNFAYGQYMDEGNAMRQNLQAVRDMDDADYQRYLTQLGQYNTDRSFAYGQHMDEVANQRQNQADLWDRAQTAAQYGDYKGLNDLGVDTSDFQSQQERQRALDDALLRAQYGDYSGLQALGVDTSGYLSSQDMWQQEMDYQREQDALAQQNWERQFSYGQSQDALARSQDDYQRRLQMAQLQAQYGDYSGLQALGVDTSGYEASAKASAGGNEGYEPRNTWAQVMDQIEKGAVGEQTARDYEYYTGRPYFNGADVTPTEYSPTGAKQTADNLSSGGREIYNMIESKLGGLTKMQVLETIQAAYERGDITDGDFEFFAARYGIK